MDEESIKKYSEKSRPEIKTSFDYPEIKSLDIKIYFKKIEKILIENLFGNNDDIIDSLYIYYKLIEG